MKNTKEWFPKILELAGTMPDARVAKITGVPASRVYRIRTDRSIPAFRCAPNTLNVGKQKAGQDDWELLNWPRTEELAASIDQIMAKKRKQAQNRNDRHR